MYSVFISGLIVIVVGLIFALGNTTIPPYHVPQTFGERGQLGEGPYWDTEQQRLYWVDMVNMFIHSYNPKTKEIFQAKVDSDKTPVTLVVRVKDTDDLFVIGLKGTLAIVQWDGVSNSTVRPVHVMNVTEDPTSRCNDGKVDPSGRLWVGVMGGQTKSSAEGNEFEKDKGELYRIDFEGTTGNKHKLLQKMQIPNGLEWSLDGKKFYIVDSLTAKLTEYQFDDEAGTLSNERLVYDLKINGWLGDGSNTLPDGMTIDEGGLLWIAVYGTGVVMRIDPRTSPGTVYGRVHVKKVLQPTSVCFGGENLDHLYVTSARCEWTPEYERKYPESGMMADITLNSVRGAGGSRPVRLPRALVDKALQEIAEEKSKVKS